jgi:hypothetical protein
MRSALKFLTFSFLIFCVLAAVPGWAQGPAANASVTSPDPAATPAPVPVPPQNSATGDDGWHFDVGPYVWLPGVWGTVGGDNHNASIHVTGSEMLSNFNGGLAGYVVARKGRFVMPVDFMWARIATTKGVPLNDFDQSSVRAQLNQVIFTPKAGYRIVDGEHFKIDALGGIRYWHEGPSLTFRPSEFNVSRSANWVDVVGGADFHYFFTPKAWVTVSGDAGGGGASLDYQGLGMLNFQPKPLFGFFVGWRYLDVHYSKSDPAFFYNMAQSGPLVGLNMQFGGKPPVPPAASCSISPSEVWAGEPVTANLSTQNFNPKHTLNYAWNTTAAKVTGTSTTGNVDTNGLAPGSYTVTGTATDPKEKKNNTASCNASFTVKTPHPPVASCSASPVTVKAGEPSTLTANGSSPDNFPITYAWTTSAGQISGSGSSATLNTNGAPEGAPITATATVTDSRGLTASCTATVNVLAPPVVVNEVSEVGDCKFMDPKRPWRVDNACKAVLDDVAMRIQREPNGKFVVVGYTDEEESVKVTQVGAQRAVNVKYYLVNGEGGSQIDASRLEVRTSGTVKEKGTKVYFVPSGATFSAESVAVDESQVKGQARNAPAPKKKAKSAPQASPAP